MSSIAIESRFACLEWNVGRRRTPESRPASSRPPLPYADKTTSAPLVCTLKRAGRQAHCPDDRYASVSHFRTPMHACMSRYLPLERVCTAATTMHLHHAADKQTSPLSRCKHTPLPLGGMTEIVSETEFRSWHSALFRSARGQDGGGPTCCPAPLSHLCTASRDMSFGSRSLRLGPGAQPHRHTHRAEQGQSKIAEMFTVRQLHSGRTQKPPRRPGGKSRLSSSWCMSSSSS